MADGIKGYFTIDEAAAKTGRARHVIWYWTKVGHLPVVRHGRLILIKETDLKAAVKKSDTGVIHRGRKKASK